MPYLVLSRDTIQPAPAAKRCEAIGALYANDEREVAEQAARNLKRDALEGIEVNVLYVPWPRKGWF